MAEKILMSPEKMRSRAATYDQKRSDVENTISAMTRLVNELQEEWKGEGSTAYAARYNELKPSFDKMAELIGEIAKSLRDSAQYMEDADAKIAAAYRG